MNDQTEMNVRFTLPQSALIACLDQTHPAASVKKAELFGLLKDGKLTPVGEWVLAGVDQTHLRHQMANLSKGGA